MRSLILVISAVFVLSLGFLVFWWTQSTKITGTKKPFGRVASTLPLHPGAREGGYTAGGIWVSRYNEKTGDLASRFRAAQYDPQPDGTVKVTAPIAEFFLYDKDSVAKDPTLKGLDRTGRRLEISGLTGDVVMPRSERGKDNFGQTESTQSPTSGNLYDVTVRMFDKLDGGHQTLIVTMNNASFDNETFRIATDAFVDPATRQKVAWDQVPVKLRGDEYDLDGRGLVIKWNDRDRRLQLLEIEHGQSLLLKHPRQFTSSAVAEPAVKPILSPAPLPATAPAENGPRPAADLTQPAHLPHPPMMSPLGGARLILAADSTTVPVRVGRTSRPPLVPGEQPERTGRVGRTTPLTTPKIVSDDEPPLYRATFFSDIHVSQLDQELITADRLMVDFLMNGDDDDSGDAAPATLPATQPANLTTAWPTVLPSAPATLPAKRVSVNGGASAAAPSTSPVSARWRARSPRANSAPATGPTQPPIRVEWSGKLQVVPLHLDEPIPPHEEVLTFEGAPVIAHQQGSKILCARLTYHTEDGLTLLESAGPAEPVIMTKRDGQSLSTVYASSVTYYRNQRVAVLHDKGHAILPVEGQTAAPARFMHAAWTKSCTIHFIGSNDNQMVMDSADLEGGVDVKHPQMKLQSQALLLTFEPREKDAPAAKAALAGNNPATNPAVAPEHDVQTTLRKMVAIGNVHCDMTTDPANRQTIDTDRLTVQTTLDAGGRLVPHTVTAEGDVHTIDPHEELTAQHLFATLMPSTRPSPEPRAAANNAGMPPKHPATNPAPSALASNGDSMELQSLTANQDVVVKLNDGTLAYADTLLVDTRDDGKRTARLLGAPMAKIVSKQNIVTGAIIEIVPDEQKFAVDGKGEMHGQQQDNPSSPARPIKIVWTRSARYDGKANLLDCLGSVVDGEGTVVATSIGADGTHNRASGGRMVAHFVDVPPAAAPASPATHPAAASAAPAIQPARAPAARASDAEGALASFASPPSPAALPAARLAAPASAPALSPATHPSASESLTGSKTVHDITFTDHAEVRSTLDDPATGKLMRLVDLFADNVQYVIEPENGKLVRHIIVPVPGKMLFEDHRPTSQPAGGEHPADIDAGSRGTSAFKWTRSMTYDDGSQKMKMEGLDQDTESSKVIVDHRDDSPSAQPTRISALEVIADVVSAPAPPVAPAAPTTLPATMPMIAPASAPHGPSITSASEMRMQVKFITAHGNVVMDAKGSEMHADRMDYDPILHLVKAFGWPNYPATFTQQSVDEGHPPTEMRASELDWDMLQDLPRAIGANAELRK